MSDHRVAIWGVDDWGPGVGRQDDTNPITGELDDTVQRRLDSASSLIEGIRNMGTFEAEFRRVDKDRDGRLTASELKQVGQVGQVGDPSAPSGRLR